jgi:hypothetical protein
MDRRSVLLASLSAESRSTDELYEQIGYGTLAQIGLIPYHAFRAELQKLVAEGVVLSAFVEDGSTTWRLAPPN